jgi:hypothetical protein
MFCHAWAQAIRACSGGPWDLPAGGHEKDTRAITEGDRIREAGRELTPPDYALVTLGHLDRGGRSSLPRMRRR